MTNVDAEFVEQPQTGRSEVAAIFRVPPHKIGILDNATFSNIEHQSLEYVTDTLMPIAVRWEDTLNIALLRESEQAEYYFEFLFDALLRGDFLSRMQGYALMRQWGRAYNDIADWRTGRKSMPRMAATSAWCRSTCGRWASPGPTRPPVSA
jgi:HK97 family phage portal protein